MQPMLDTSHLPRVPEWKKAGDFEDILYEKSEEGIAKEKMPSAQEETRRFAATAAMSAATAFRV